LMDRLLQLRRRLRVWRRRVFRFATPHAVHTVLPTNDTPRPAKQECQGSKLITVRVAKMRFNPKRRGRHRPP
jgi:hypothetical protein